MPPCLVFVVLGPLLTRKWSSSYTVFPVHIFLRSARFAQQINALAEELDDPGLASRTHMGERKEQTPPVVKNNTRTCTHKHTYFFPPVTSWPLLFPQHDLVSHGLEPGQSFILRCL